MPTQNISLLIGALVFIIVARWFLKQFFTEVGRKALAKQATEIHLLPTSDKAWQNLAAVEAIARPLIARGFTDVGTFVIREMPVTLRMFAKPDAAVCATIYEHAKVGVWMDLYSRHQDDTGYTLATTRDRGLDQRPGRPVVHVPGLTADEAYEEFMRTRPDVPRKVIAPDELVAFYERSYAEQMAWRKNKGISAEEVARVAKSRQGR